MRCPPALLSEYHALANKEIDGGLTRAEERRRRAILSEMNAIDRADPDVQANLKTVDDQYRRLCNVEKRLKREIAEATK